MQDPTRRGLLKAGAAGAALLAGIGFDRRAHADHHESITQLAEFKLDPARKDEGVEALKTLAAAVEEREPGVLAYIPHLAADDESSVVFWEVYENEAALANHGQQPHLAKLRESFQSGLFLPPVKITKLDAVGGYSR